MSNNPDDKISRLRKEMQAIVYGSEYQPIDDFIYSEDEEQGWKASEPDFTKQITAPLPFKLRHRFTRREDLAMGLIFLGLALSMAHYLPQVQAYSGLPNELPHLHLPNGNDALPYAR